MYTEIINLTQVILEVGTRSGAEHARMAVFAQASEHALLYADDEEYSKICAQLAYAALRDNTKRADKLCDRLRTLFEKRDAEAEALLEKCEAEAGS